MPDNQENRQRLTIAEANLAAARAQFQALDKATEAGQDVEEELDEMAKDIAEYEARLEAAKREFDRPPPFNPIRLSLRVAK